MLTSVLLAATISLSASPAAYDNAQAHQSYQITITSGSSSPMAVRATLAPDNNCSIELAQRPTWATMNGPSSFTLAPHAKQSFVVSVGQPPPGNSELVATFVASDPSPKTGVSTSAGVGTALRFSEPGHTVVTPCPKPKPTKAGVRTIVVGASNLTHSNTLPLQIAVTVLGCLLLAAAVTIAIVRRPGRKGSHR